MRMSGEVKENRNYHRYGYKTRIWLLQSEGAEPVPMTTVNISAGGLLIETDKKIPLDANVKLSIEYPFYDGRVTAMGKVVRVSEGDYGGSSVRYGIQLLAVEGVTEEQLSRFLHSILS